MGDDLGIVNQMFFWRIGDWTWQTFCYMPITDGISQLIDGVSVVFGDFGRFCLCHSVIALVGQFTWNGSNVAVNRVLLNAARVPSGPRYSSRTIDRTMGLLPDTQICGCACAGNAGNVFPVTAGKRSRHASRHVRHARAVMHAGIANQRFPLKSAAGENVPGIPGACATCNFTYLVRGPCIRCKGTRKRLTFFSMNSLRHLLWIMSDTTKAVAFGDRYDLVRRIWWVIITALVYTFAVHTYGCNTPSRVGGKIHHVFLTYS